MLVACLTLAWQVNIGVCLECYSCSNVSVVAMCTQVVQCPTGQVCHKSVSAAGRYTLGCKAHDTCNIVKTDSSTLVGRTVQTKRLFTSTTNHVCSECCENGLCNRQLCQHNNTGCQDSGHIVCQTTGALINLCTETSHARKECKRFCGLCSVVDGGWSTWSSWSSCSTSCGNGTETRTRQCSNPVPVDGGAQCVGTDHDNRMCSNPQCPVDGGWSAWTNWDACSVTCGVGLKRRTRTCTNPAPALSGLNCLGDVTSVDICLLQACQDGTWSKWGAWSSCSVTCGVCPQTRHRSCTGQTVGKTCTGDNNEVKASYTSCGGKTQTKDALCETISTWSPWVDRNTPTPSTDEKEAVSPNDLAFFCGTRASNLTAIECLTLNNTAFNSTTDVGTTCDVTNGLFCSAAANSPNGCQDYKIRYECTEETCVIGFQVSNPQYEDAGSIEALNRLHFINITSNSSGGYDLFSGAFICRVPGVYIFSLSLVTLPGTKALICVIFKNSEDLGMAVKVNIGDGSVTSLDSFVQGIAYLMMPASKTTVTHLNTGDEVYVNCTYYGDKPDDSADSNVPSYYHSSFSGYLIKKD